MEFTEQFSNPVIVSEDMSGIRDEMQYGTYVNHRLHKLPFRKFETLVSYKATWREISTDTVDAYYNSQTCSCCGECGYRWERRFHCTNDEYDVVQDHADRIASVNIAWREKAKLDGNESDYRTHITQPQVRLVRLSRSGACKPSNLIPLVRGTGSAIAWLRELQKLGPPRPRLFTHRICSLQE
ncbi:IS1341-type transposase [Natronorubrum tibetense GA33]|uniref:IS1341-type transposase n=1 Tax=Natronorubrum tibetense GA33 TaxID=1114856 RepID=L9VU56_9EURY|nr:zinc ribbon domain-containing protein [Natronorubrum tibetense]ELY39808.1 IS1341-type transposase [Natronorubrum tibetense GA33]